MKKQYQSTANLQWQSTILTICYKIINLFCLGYAVHHVHVVFHTSIRLNTEKCVICEYTQ